MLRGFELGVQHHSLTGTINLGHVFLNSSIEVVETEACDSRIKRHPVLGCISPCNTGPWLWGLEETGSPLCTRAPAAAQGRTGLAWLFVFTTSQSQAVVTFIL